MQTRTAPQFQSYTATKPVVVKLNTPDGIIDVFESEETGRVVTRKKIDTVSNVYHPGIGLGRDSQDRLWVAHNHYQKKRPTIDLGTVYAKGQDVTYDNRDVIHSRKDVAQRAVDEVMKGKSYDKFSYNCQTFVNVVVQGKKKSEAVDDWSNGLMIGGTIVGLLGLLAGNKAVAIGGFGVAAIAGGVKIYSRADWGDEY